MKIIHFGKVTDGYLDPREPDKLRLVLLKLEGCECKLTIEKLYDTRSVNQNSYYWGVVVSSFVQGWQETTGELITSDQAHEMLKYHCNTVELQIIEKKVAKLFAKSKGNRIFVVHKVERKEMRRIKTAGTTTDLSTLEFEQYQERCRVLILEYFNLVVPLPNED